MEILGNYTATVSCSCLWPGTLIFMEEKIPAAGVAAYALKSLFSKICFHICKKKDSQNRENRRHQHARLKSLLKY